MKKMLGLLLSLFVLFVLVACGETEAEEEPVEEVVEEDTEEEIEEADEEIAEEETEETAQEQEDGVPSEHQDALQAAQEYVDLMPYSEARLFEQLTFEHGEQYSEEAAEYAIENVDVDYNEEALEAAEIFQEAMPLTDEELFEQLTSEEYGEQFTEEQAQYAIDNLGN